MSWSEAVLSDMFIPLGATVRLGPMNRNRVDDQFATFGAKSMRRMQGGCRGCVDSGVDKYEVHQRINTYG